MKEATNEKLAVFVFNISVFIWGLITAMSYGWKLAVVVYACAPLILITKMIENHFQTKLATREMEAYSIAGGVAEEVLGSIRTVMAFSGESKESIRYCEKLKPAEVNGNRRGFFSALGGGVMWLIVYFTHGVALWYGVQLILEDREKPVRQYTINTMVIVSIVPVKTFISFKGLQTSSLLYFFIVNCLITVISV